MKKVPAMLCALALVMAMLYGMHTLFASSEQESPSPVVDEIISSEESVTEPPQEEDEIIINKVHVTEQPLSEINTEESDRFANWYNVSQPYFDGDNDMFYYCIFQKGDSPSDYLYYDNGVDEPTNAGVPEIDDFHVRIIIDGAIYGVEYGVEYDRTDLYSKYITRYKNGVGERLTDDPVKGCYFAEEGIYYQIENKINLMDYNGQNSKPIVEIPDELYSDDGSPKFIVYRGNLWYCYDRDVKDHYYPLWCYDFDKTFTRFDNGGLDAVNNGFLYYQEPYPADQYLYRFNCETYTVERVGDSARIFDYAFSDNHIFHISFDSSGSTSHLYRMNQKENEKILSPESLRHSNDLLCISCVDNRIFVTGHEGIFYSCLAEIDADGNIIRIIHEDEYW